MWFCPECEWEGDEEEADINNNDEYIYPICGKDLEEEE